MFWTRPSASTSNLTLAKYIYGFCWAVTEFDGDLPVCSLPVPMQAVRDSEKNTNSIILTVDFTIATHSLS
jgi:hypothetical protein